MSKGDLIFVHHDEVIVDRDDLRVAVTWLEGNLDGPDLAAIRRLQQTLDNDGGDDA